MPKSYSRDLRERVVRSMEAGAPAMKLRRRSRYRVRRSVGCVAAKLIGGKRSLLDAHQRWLLELVAAEPDLTMEEIRGRLRARSIRVSASSVWRSTHILTGARSC
jgi:hypothetical protein